MSKADEAIAAAELRLDSTERVNNANRAILATIKVLTQEERMSCISKLIDTIAEGEADADAKNKQLRPGMEALRELH